VVAADARRAGLRVELDLRYEKINYKVREHSLAKIPALLVVCKKEAATQSVSVRRLGCDGLKVMPTEEAVAALVDEATQPYLKRARAAG
jgi:threonyl-tRNA synthetase